ncbi:MAG: histidine phosphatase family protein [Isosphaeraceae bacterium]
MEETRVLLLRHAETSAPDRFHGAESDIGLGDRGRGQALAVAQWLARERPSALYTSGMRRALETAAPIGLACGLSAQVEVALHERKMGPLSGLTREEGLVAYTEARARWAAGETSHTHQGGESFDDVKARVLPVWRRLTTDQAGRTLVIVAHGVVIRVLLATVLEGRGPRDFERFAIDNTAVNDLRGHSGSWRAVALNQRIGEDFDSFSW